MSECYEQIHRALLSYDESDLYSCVSRLAHAARRNNQSVEGVIIELKRAVSLVPVGSLRERARRELRDAVVRVAIGAYYDGMDSPVAQARMG